MRTKQNFKLIGMIPLSSIATSAYTDLVRLLKDDALSGVEGKPTLKERGDKAYWYAARRVGTEMQFIYIGEDSDETRARIERIEELCSVPVSWIGVGPGRLDMATKGFTV